MKKEMHKDSKQQPQNALLADIPEADALQMNGGCHRYGYRYGYSGYRPVAYARPTYTYNYRPLYL